MSTGEREKVKEIAASGLLGVDACEVVAVCIFGGAGMLLEGKAEPRTACWTNGSWKKIEKDFTARAIPSIIISSRTICFLTIFLLSALKVISLDR
jgi:hypothetical protein